MADDSDIDGKPKAVEQDTIIEISSDDDFDYSSGNDFVNNVTAAATAKAPYPKVKQTTTKKTFLDSKPQTKNNRHTRKTEATTRARPLQSGLVLAEDVDECVIETADFSAGLLELEDEEALINSNWTMKYYVKHQQERIQQGQAMELYHDPDFESIPASIEGATRQNKKDVTCWCKQLAQLSYTKKGPNRGKPYYHCPKGRCRFWNWAFKAEQMHWYRFGSHTGHVLVKDEGFSANDMLQGKVGDCWFLSALAVIAERDDLIARIFGGDFSSNNNPYGIVQVNLFLDGFWRRVTMDNFLPCVPCINEDTERDLQAAINTSLGLDSNNSAFHGRGRTLESPTDQDAEYMGNAKNEEKEIDNSEPRESSKHDPYARSDINLHVLATTESFLKEQKKATVNPYAKKPSGKKAWKNHADTINSSSISLPKKLNRTITTEDLAYSKAKHNQLWVPFLEKAYAKSHGSYAAISGGWIAEAFLDLTGAPTMSYQLHHENGFDARAFWYKLMSYHHQRLPMGCGTSSSAQGIIGMHAYSIIQVREIKGVGLDFFRDKMIDRTLGNVSGFIEFDGTVRLLRIRNPHGKGEWKGEWSDHCDIWDQLLRHKQHNSQDDIVLSDFERTKRNDGTFWISYDDFLLGFSNVDVVLAFPGNCARSFLCNFPEKKSNHRCARAFEVSLLDSQPGIPSRDTVELFVMGIQKTQRGARGGRSDRKVSYKLSDFGILVGEPTDQSSKGCDIVGNAKNLEEFEFKAVEGEMFGFKRNGHYRLILNRKTQKKLVVMPISFGHPAATDEHRSFAIRFVSDSPVFIRELETVPAIDRVLRQFCFPVQPSLRTKQGAKKVILDDQKGIEIYGEARYRVFQIDYLASQGGVVFVYICINRRLLDDKSLKNFSVNLTMEATCRGMVCRTESGFLKHETITKVKKFEAAWRKYEALFPKECRTRLLAVLVQSGQDSEMGHVCFNQKQEGQKVGVGTFQTKMDVSGTLSSQNRADDFDALGIFHGNQGELSKGERATMFGPRPSGLSFATRRSLVSLDDFDLELERALALSRGDIEMKEVLELSKLDTGPISPSVFQSTAVAGSDDAQLQLALERSKMETSAKTDPINDAIYGNNGVIEAIKRSLERAKQYTDGADDAEVIELDGNGGEKESPKDRKPFPNKRQRVAEPVIEIIDDGSIDDNDESSKDLPLETADVGTAKKTTGNDSRQGKSNEKGGKAEAILLEEKRRLAAKAAEMRLRSKAGD